MRKIIYVYTILLAMTWMTGIVRFLGPYSVVPWDARDHVAQKDQAALKNRVLQSGCRIRYKSKTGSGTIFQFDEKRSVAYVISCGHIFSTRRKKNIRDYDLACRVTTFYEDGRKLKNPRIYNALALFAINEDDKDISLIAFLISGKPSVNSISKEYLPENGDEFYSVGCDGGEEVGGYKTILISTRYRDYFITRYNSPRPGRSGGALLDKNKKIVGICSKTSYEDGSGLGFFIDIYQIHDVLDEEGYAWLIR